MANSAVIGDEKKSKVVDVLAPKFDDDVRFQGGHNAGHNVFDGERFALHALPSGVFHKGTINVIANGVVVEPFSLVEAIEGRRARRILLTPANLRISDRAHLILPYHGIIDRFRDSLSGEPKIGTTGRGIGLAYEWKAARRRFPFADIRHPEFFREQLEAEMSGRHPRYKDVHELHEWSAGPIITE